MTDAPDFDQPGGGTAPDGLPHQPEFHDGNPEDETPVRGEIVPVTTPGLAPGLEIVPAQAELENLAALAVTFSRADIVPAALKNKPNDIMLVLMTARDLGVSVTTAMREFHVIEGKVTLSPKVKLALIHSQKLGRIFPHQAPRNVVVDGEQQRIFCPCGDESLGNDGERATWHAEREDQPGILHTSTFTLEQAANVPTRERGANIKLSEKSNWKAYPARMLSWRALGYLEDDVFPEVGTGLYQPDELGALTDEGGQPIDVSTLPALPGMKGPAAAAKPQPVELADEAVIREIQDRVNAVKAHSEEAKDDLGSWWLQREVGAVGRLTAPAARTVMAKLEQVEAKHGIQKPEPTEEPAQEPEEGEEAQTPEEQPAEQQGGQEGPEPAPEGKAPAVVDPTKGDGIPTSPPDGDVAGWLIQRASAMSTPSLDASWKRRNLPVPGGKIADKRRAWAVDQMIQHGRAATALVCLFLGVPCDTAALTFDA